MLPTSLPILPLHNDVLLPSIVTTVSVCKEEGNRLLNSNYPYLICVPIKNEGNNSSSLSDLFHYGCAAEIIDCDGSLPHQFTFKVKGICPSRIRDISNEDGGCLFEALLEHYYLDTQLPEQQEIQQFHLLCHTYVNTLRLIGISSHVLLQLERVLTSYPIPQVANFLLYLMDAPLLEKLRVLEILDLKQRLSQVNQVVTRHIQSITTKSLQSNNDMIHDQIRRKFYVGQQLHSLDANHSQANGEDGNQFTVLSEDDEETVDLISKLNKASLPDHAFQAVKRELNRLRKLPASSADSAVLRTYIEYIGELPWSMKEEAHELNLSLVKKQLDADHYGIDSVKTRILEYLSVLKVKKDAKAPILCFVGPPGVGKTTLGKSIALALQRKFYRMSLGGVRDEAEIRGHRRTYVGALPGLLIHGMRQSAVQNPVFLLDEIDKLVSGSNQGDPGAALLEVLDPAQNSTFTDHFINIPYDLSKVMFIATANSLETIPRPLLDRMEVIQLSGYTYQEKLHIAKTHLIPKQLEAHGNLDIHIPSSVILRLAEKYTREGGVRNLDRLIASLCRFKCKEYTDLLESGQVDQFDGMIQEQDLEKILGVEILDDEGNDTEAIPGVVTGLAYSGSGNGGTMMIEANCMPGNGGLKLTGSLGDVIKESAQLAVSWVKANAFALKLTHSPKENVLRDIDLHIHMPSGAIPKDGPSAGITMVICLVSLISDIPVPNTIAMTGEVTLRGQVRPVGGIKEKVMSAHRAGVKKVLLPAANRRDIINDVPVDIRNDMTFVYCKSMWDVIESVFDQQHVKFETRYASNL